MIAPGIEPGRERWGWNNRAKRAESRTDVCLRWSHQSVLVGDTVYIYGGQAKTSPDQSLNTWNNNFLTLDLGKDWSIAAPYFQGLPQPDGPPAVANGYLWHNSENIYLYGGLFSDKPDAAPTAFSLWQYNIKSAEWSDITSKTSIDSDSGGKSIQRAAEGAGVSIPDRGLGYYFGGHLDSYTTEGWSKQTPRIYLKSLLQFDMNKNQFLNVTENGLEDAGVPERADSVLLFVPWGSEGILVGIGGGLNDTFSQLNIIDIYDVSSRKWTKQATDGTTPKYRVNPCAVVGSASDGSSHNIYFFGGQNLVPYGEQVQYNDMWILSIPSFSWIKVDTDGQTVPSARAGHTCELHGSDMVVIGGYVGQELSCDSPGIYVFDAYTTQWKTEYKSPTSSSSNSAEKEVAGFYRVPDVVINPDSPVATGKPGDYKYTTITSHTAAAPTVATITNSDGSVSTTTTYANSTILGDPNDPGKSPNVGLIIGASLAGIVLLVLLLLGAAYMWYRKKIKELREASEKLASNMEYSGGMGREGLGGELERSESANELLGEEPTFWGVLLSPRRSLRVVNH
ncbi:uncharacterized protein LAJ45_06477 [Morchella importuna]|uniref:uncharacterized protein n=1 Tax=Morchella importuna TaxID=1174673 RepID=UPI001E8EEC0C|nr:uncharacterized protein LAJ45_06477 [Morchella importuna]KAH8149398.1 hypothetical protein LAJ45_06477 [Morchella importuna]